MKMKQALLFLALIGLSTGCVTTPSAPLPTWLQQRPVQPGYYIGIGRYHISKGERTTYQEKAKMIAISDLSSEIAVTINSEFLLEITETSGTTREEAVSEIRAFISAKLSEYEQIDSWRSGNQYAVYYRLSKQAYVRQVKARMARSVKVARETIILAHKERRKANANGALQIYMQALAELQDAAYDQAVVGDEHSVLSMVNALYSDIQAVLGSIEVSAYSKLVFGLAGHPLRTPIIITATTTLKGRARVGANGLTILFSSDGSNNTIDRQTDGIGRAYYQIKNVQLDSNGKTIRARMSIAHLYEHENNTAFFTRLLSRLTLPETDVVLKVFPEDKKEDYFWHNEFEGANVGVICLYDNKGKVSQWPNIHDALTTAMQGNGANLKEITIDPEKVLKWSTNPNSSLLKCLSDAPDILLVVVASGKINHRIIKSSPSGEAFQFSGEVRTITLKKNGGVSFSDRYVRTGGWNPMGEQRCIDVLALHAAKRWNSQYLKHLGLQNDKPR
jgi:hypothetical protein